MFYRQYLFREDTVLIYVSRLVEKATNMKVNYVLNYRGRTDYEVYLSDTESKKITICNLVDILQYEPEGIFCDFVNVLTKAEILLTESLNINHNLVPEKDAKIAYLNAQCLKTAWKYQDASKLLRANEVAKDVDYVVIKYTAGVQTVIPYTKEFEDIYMKCKISFFKERFRLGYI